MMTTMSKNYEIKFEARTFPHSSQPEPPKQRTCHQLERRSRQWQLPLELSLERHKKFIKYSLKESTLVPTTAQLQMIQNGCQPTWLQLLNIHKIWFGFPSCLELVCPLVCCFTAGVPIGVP